MLHSAVLLLPRPVRAIPMHPEIEAPLSVNVTLPVGFVPATVAVNLIELPTTDGFAELATPALDVTLLTDCVNNWLDDAPFSKSPK